MTQFVNFKKRIRAGARAPSLSLKPSDLKQLAPPSGQYSHTDFLHP